MDRLLKSHLEAGFSLSVSIDCFSAASDLNLRDPTVCQEITQTFLCVNVIFSIFISKKCGPRETASPLQATLYQHCSSDLRGWVASTSLASPQVVRSLKEVWRLLSSCYPL